ncbi:NUDIX hydrolase [Halotalea alkalilenta]|uniref:NUDIX hydrolase n=1 Tax=Halotalea alkalilenta TaxID=376489 RepID=UPI00048728D9|nr:NUDIX hydrolase [Halotalea alkalilenta]
MASSTPESAVPAARPRVAVAAVVMRATQVLLVGSHRAGIEGYWGFPGGKLEFGETLFQAAERELLEETGVAAVAREVLTAVDVLVGEAVRPRAHFVLIATLCEYQAGEPVAADDAESAGWFPFDRLDSLPLYPSVSAIVELARQRSS